MADTVLVTGGAGYIGSHIVVELARVGHQPIVVDNFCNSSPSVIPRLCRITDRQIPCISADVRDKAALSRIFTEHSIAAVVHCAGLKAVGEGEAQPLSYYDNNVGGAIALVAAMADGRGQAAGVQLVGRRLWAARSAIPSPKTRRFARTTSTAAPSASSSSCSRTSPPPIGSWRIALLRYFNPAGAHSSAAIGEAPSGSPNNLVPLLAGRRRRKAR